MGDDGGTRNASDADDLLARWQEWLTDDGPISGTVLRLEVDDDRWNRLLRLVSANPAIPHPADTLGWFGHHYVCDAAVRLRRLADEDDRSASLGRLLVEVEENCALLTRSDYLRRWRSAVPDDELWPLIHEPTANQWFDEFAGDGGSCVQADQVTADLEALRTALAPIKFYVDKRLAHHNPKFEPELTYEEISRGRAAAASTFRKYVRLVRRVELPLVSDNTMWGDAFTVAWAPPEG